MTRAMWDLSVPQAGIKLTLSALKAQSIQGWITKDFCNFKMFQQN